MSGIAKVSEKMKKKISFGDYALSPPQEAKAARKIYSLSNTDAQKLHDIFTKRLNTAQQTSIADIMSEAIQLLYLHEQKI